MGFVYAIIATLARYKMRSSQIYYAINRNLCYTNKRKKPRVGAGRIGRTKNPTELVLGGV